MIPCPHCGEELVTPGGGMGSGNPYERICHTCGWNALVMVDKLLRCAECHAPIVWCIETGEDYLCCNCRSMSYV